MNVRSSFSWATTSPRLRVACVAIGLLCGCGDPTLESATPAQEPSGSERMRARLSKLTAESSPRNNPYRNAERLAALLAQSDPTDFRKLFEKRLEIGVESLLAGENSEAVEVFDALRAQIRENSSAFPTGLEQKILSLLATAHLRLAEQQNCLEMHSSRSCIFPPRDRGIHSLPESGRRAFELFAQLQSSDPDDIVSRWLTQVTADVTALDRASRPLSPALAEVWTETPSTPTWFLDDAPRAGVDTVGLSGGAILEDLDGDGLKDVLVSSWGLRDELMLAIQSPTTSHLEFTPASPEAGLTGLTGGLNLVSADVDNDGDTDVLVLRGAWLGREGKLPNSLLLNDGSGRFEDITEEAGLLSYRPTQTAAWADIDRDGWLDLFVGNESAPGDRQPCELYLNRGLSTGGTLRFEEAASLVGLEVTGFVKAVAWTDFDNDGWPDLYVSRLRAPNLLYRHLGMSSGQPSFEEVGARAGVQHPIDSFPVATLDFDQDGWTDLFVGDFVPGFKEARGESAIRDLFGEPSEAERWSRLFRNRGDGTFEDVTVRTDLDRSFLVMGLGVGDFDNDGYPDLYLGTGAPDYRVLIPNRALQNRAGTSFLDVTARSGLGHLQKGHGIAFGDVDRDGDEDILAVLGGAFSGDVYPNALFLNGMPHPHRSVDLHLVGTRSNRSAIGARVEVAVAGPDGVRIVHASVGPRSSFGASTLDLLVGIGTATEVQTVDVQWPGGGRESFGGVRADRAYDLVEGTGRAAER